MFRFVRPWFSAILFGGVFALLAGCASNPPAASSPAPAAAQNQGDTYNEYETTNEAVNFLGGSAEAIAKVMDKAFADYGRPNAYIKGEEGGGAIVFGLRYGKGEFVSKTGEHRTVYWQGPSVGWDFGADAGKVFILVYNLPNSELLFQRFPGVNGSLYFLGGIGMNYLRSDNIVLAPIRVGVGMRLGASVGYMSFTKEQSYNPF